MTKDQLQLASATAGLLHRVFYQTPNDDFFNQLRTLMPHWPAFIQDPTSVASQVLAGIDSDGLRAINDDYHRLFIGPGKRLAYPWGSVYTDKENLLFGRSCVDFEQFCRRYGIEFELRGNEPMDHIGLILAALSGLFYQAAETENGIDVVTELLEQHLLPWSHGFWNAIDDHAESDYYQGFGELLRMALTDWQQQLKLTPANLRLYK